MIKFIHILGVVLFLGNIIVSAVWRLLAERSEDLAVKRFSLKLTQLTDWIFTLPGVILIGISGHMLAPSFGGIVAFGWIYHSYALLTISALIWLAFLIPIQRKQIRLLKDIHSFEPVKSQYLKLNKWWSILSSIATILVVIGLYLMTVRPV